MANKRIKTQTKPVQHPADTARKLWLAGLGAFSVARRRGGETFSSLIGEGKQFQTHAQKLAHEIRTDAQAQIKGSIAPLRSAWQHNIARTGAAVQKGIGVVLARAGIPSKADIEELTRRVSALSRQLKSAK